MAYDPNGGASNEALRIAADHNFFPAHTGGGCFAFQRDDDRDGHHHLWMITFGHDPVIDGDPSAREWYVARYWSNADYSKDAHGRLFGPMTLEEALEYSGKIGDPRLASSHFAVGERVTIVREIDNYPVGKFPAGEYGEVTEAHADHIMIKMDRNFPELAEWQNCLQVYEHAINSVWPADEEG